MNTLLKSLYRGSRIGFSSNTKLNLLNIQRKHTYDGADTVAEDSEVNVGKFGPFTVIRLNRPEKRNCLNYSTAVKLKEALTNFNNDKLSSLCIICGEGGNFCSGLDCNELAHDNKFYKKFIDLKLTDEFCKKPTIASVDGYCVGAGFDLALWCDLRVVEETAIFGYLNRRIGVPVAETSINRLVKLVGLARAVDWVVTGRIIKASEGQEAGIVSRSVATGTAYGQAISLARTIGKYDFPTMMWDRINLYSNSFSSEETENMLKDKKNLVESLEQTITSGAKRFISGYGRHGKSGDIKLGSRQWMNLKGS